MSLFHTTETSLAKAIADLTTSQLRSLVGSTIFQRGESYYASGAVEDISYTDRRTLEATVSGSEFYSIMISLEGDSVEADCDCPFDGGTCKHIVAVLLEAMNEGESVRDYPDDDNDEEEDSDETEQTGVLPLKALGKAGSPPTASKEFRQYVESLPLKELQELVLQYAPENFRRTVLTRSLSASDAEKVMNAAERAVQNIFNNDYLRHDNDKLEQELMRQCERVRGLWATFPERVASMLVEIMTTIDEGFEEGDFYEDDEDEGFISDDFDSYVVQFLRAVPLDKKHTIVQQIEEFLGSTGFSNFDRITKRKPEWFSREELPAMKDAILNDIRKKKYDGDPERDYATISPDLSDEEREMVLLAFYNDNSNLTLELANLYTTQHKFNEALTVVDMRLKKVLVANSWWSGGIMPLLQRRLALAATTKEPPKAYLQQAEKILKYHPRAELLLAAAEYLGSFVTPLETLVGKERPEELFTYLDKQGRFEECWQMIQAQRVQDDTAYDFAVKHLRTEPDDAKGVLLRRIEAYKPLTGDAAYHKIAEALKQLRIIDKAKTQKILLDLRTNYKRRTNLMKILNAAFRPL